MEKPLLFFSFLLELEEVGLVEANLLDVGDAGKLEHRRGAAHENLAVCESVYE